jgi:hypothetical protein
VRKAKRKGRGECQDLLAFIAVSPESTAHRISAPVLEMVQSGLVSAVTRDA